MVDKMTYNKIVEVLDWGAVTTKLIVDLGCTVRREDVPWNSFDVSVKRYDRSYDRSVNPPLIEEGPRDVVGLYVSDEKGEKADQGRYVTLELACHPAITLGSELHWGEGGAGWIEAEYTIKQMKDIPADKGVLRGLIITRLNETIRPQLDRFTYGYERFIDPEEGDVTMAYASFSPGEGGEKKPLIVWLHGLGEGGSDPTFPIAGNKACHFASDEIQQYFGGAYVLAPQSPGYWMEPSRAEALALKDNVEAQPETRFQLVATSKYTKTLMHVIEMFVNTHDDIDRNRIYIGGNSMGGFMTLRMLLDYPDYFAAGFPVCPAMLASHLSDDDVEKLKRQNLWFVTAAADTTVPGPPFTIGVYEKIIQAGGKNVWLYYPARVVDRSGLYLDEMGQPYEYNGHFSWIDVYNNDASVIIDGRRIYLMDWLSRQRLPRHE